MLRQAEASDRVRLRRTACAFPHPIANFFETAASEPQLSFHRNPNRLAKASVGGSSRIIRRQSLRLTAMPTCVANSYRFRRGWSKPRPCLKR